jgi:hypothetical protein
MPWFLGIVTELAAIPGLKSGIASPSRGAALIGSIRRTSGIIVISIIIRLLIVIGRPLVPGHKAILVISVRRSLIAVIPAGA